MKSNNGLIAEFMGLRWETKPNYTGWYKGDNRIAGEDTLQFDKSWDWLMPVVEKIETIDDIKFSFTDSCAIKIFGKGGGIYPTYAFVDVADVNRKHTTYKAVVAFIKWYNENKK